MKFKGDIRELLIGSWKAIETAKGRPTINAVLRACRENYGATFDNTFGQSVLKPFSDKAAQSRLEAKQAKQRKRSENAAERSEVPVSFSRTNSEVAVSASENAAAIRARVVLPLVPYSDDVARARADGMKERDEGDEANDLADLAFKTTLGMTQAKREENMRKLASLGIVPPARPE
jgi:hypothetical protein